MRIYYKLLGGHYHCRCFFHGLAGTLVIGQNEWREFQAQFSTNVTFSPDES